MTTAFKIKSRKQTLYEFFETVQLEYLVAELRFRIYLKQKDKSFWLKVAEGKKKTIEDIAERNQLPTIFSDLDMHRAFEARIYKSNIPNFFYKDAAQEEQQGFYDLMYYFRRGVDVRCEVDEEVKIATVSVYNPYSKVITVELKETGVEIQLPIASVKRIL